jgi:Fic family protein
MSFDRSKPYNNLPRLPPSVDIETKAILKAAINAARALAELKQAGGLVPNQAVLINTIPLLEAQVSSEIENIVTTTDKLFRLAANEKAAADPATKEALRYRTALHGGFQSISKRPLCTGTAVDVCQTIRNVEVDIRAVPGTFVGNPRTGKAHYTPPEGPDRIRGMLANWERFVNEAKDIDPLIRLAIMHYQFEAIHPFTDGNGRTGRVLNILFLVQEGLLEIPVLYLSLYILQNRASYYRLLLGVAEEQAWEQWILFMLEAVEKTAQWTSKKIRAIRDLLEKTSTFVRTRLPKIYSHELVESVFVQPYCRISNLVDSRIAQRQTASVYLKALADIGVLREERVGREKLFVHPKFLRLLTTDENKFEPYES